MKSQIKIQSGNWSLFRLSDRKQFDNVSLEAIDFFFRANTAKTRVDWLMWREGFTGWRPLGELSLILNHLQSELTPLPVPPPVPEVVLKFAEEITGVQLHGVTSEKTIKKPTSTFAENGKVLSMNDEATLSLMLESQAATEDRDNVRFQKHFKIRIFTPTGVVSMMTIDCSTSGFRLKEALPPGLARFFHVEIDLGPEGKIPLVCSEIREKSGQGATRVRIQVNDHANVLKSALVRAA